MKWFNKEEVINQRKIEVSDLDEYSEMSYGEFTNLSAVKIFNIIGIFYNAYVSGLTKTNFFDFGKTNSTLLPLSITNEGTLQIPSKKDVSADFISEVLKSYSDENLVELLELTKTQYVKTIPTWLENKIEDKTGNIYQALFSSPHNFVFMYENKQDEDLTIVLLERTIAKFSHWLIRKGTYAKNTTSYDDDVTFDKALVYVDAFINDETKFNEAVFSSYHSHTRQEGFFRWVIEADEFKSQYETLKKLTNAKTLYLVLVKDTEKYIIVQSI